MWGIFLFDVNTIVCASCVVSKTTLLCFLLQTMALFWFPPTHREIQNFSPFYNFTVTNAFTEQFYSRIEKRRGRKLMELFDVLMICILMWVYMVLTGLISFCCMMCYKDLKMNFWWLYGLWQWVDTVLLIKVQCMSFVNFQPHKANDLFTV